MPRLFTGLELPAELATELALMRGGLTGARWIDVENYHLTLRFIGDIDQPTAEAVADVMAQIRRKPFTVTLEGLDHFGGDKPRAIVARAHATPRSTRSRITSARAASCRGASRPTASCSTLRAIRSVVVPM